MRWAWLGLAHEPKTHQQAAGGILEQTVGGKNKVIFSLLGTKIGDIQFL
jgi:hypothetical protein